MKESRFLGTILIESPLMFEILEKIREKYSVDKLDPNEDPYKQRVRQHMEQDPPIDQQAGSNPHRLRHLPQMSVAGRWEVQLLSDIWGRQGGGVPSPHSAMGSKRQIPYCIELSTAPPALEI